MNLLGAILGLLGLALIWGGVVYDRKKHENDSVSPDVD
jgi:Ca2+/H+ antiporter